MRLFVQVTLHRLLCLPVNQGHAELQVKLLKLLNNYWRFRDVTVVIESDDLIWFDDVMIFDSLKHAAVKWWGWSAALHVFFSLAFEQEHLTLHVSRQEWS